MAGNEVQATEEMLLLVVRSIADHPEDVEVGFISDEEGEAFQVRAHGEDLGRLIGKNGQTAKALQAIINASGKRNGRRYQLDIVGPDEDLDDE